MSQSIDMPAGMRAHGNFSDASLKWLHSVLVSINHMMSLSDAADLELPLGLTYMLLKLMGWVSHDKDLKNDTCNLSSF